MEPAAHGQHDPIPRVTMHVMVGLPGSGKTTRAKELEATTQALRLTPDEWMIPLFGDLDAGGKRDVLEGRFVWLALRSLAAGLDVVLDFGVWSRQERTALRSLAHGVGAACRLVYLPADENELRNRVRARYATAPGTTFEMNDETYDGYLAKFQPPGQDELTGGTLDEPPAPYPTWAEWSAVRWPTSSG